MLRALGVSIPPPVERAFHGVTVPLGASIVLHPSFAPCCRCVCVTATAKQAQQHAPSPSLTLLSRLLCSVLSERLSNPRMITISGRSTFLIRGKHIAIDELEVPALLTGPEA